MIMKDPQVISCFSYQKAKALVIMPALRAGAAPQPAHGPHCHPATPRTRQKRPGHPPARTHAPNPAPPRDLRNRLLERSTSPRRTRKVLRCRPSAAGGHGRGGRHPAGGYSPQAASVSSGLCSGSTGSLADHRAAAAGPRARPRRTHRERRPPVRRARPRRTHRERRPRRARRASARAPRRVKSCCLRSSRLRGSPAGAAASLPPGRRAPGPGDIGLSRLSPRRIRGMWPRTGGSAPVRPGLLLAC